VWADRSLLCGLIGLFCVFIGKHTHTYTQECITNGTTVWVDRLFVWANRFLLCGLIGLFCVG